MTPCKRGHVAGRDKSYECKECRRDRQRTQDFLQKQRAWQRGRATRADLQTLREIEQWLADQK